MSSPTKSTSPLGPGSPPKLETTSSAEDQPQQTTQQPASPPKLTVSSDTPTETPSSPSKASAALPALEPTSIQPTPRPAVNPAPTLILPTAKEPTTASSSSSPSPTAISLASASPPVLAPVQALGGPMSPPPPSTQQPQNGTATRSFPQPSKQQQAQPAASHTIRKPNRPGIGGPSAYAAPPAPSTGTALSTAQPTQQQQQPTAAQPSNAASSASSTAGTGNSQFPALHLTPLNDTFVPKQISLAPAGTKVKIGRQTNAKTIPNGMNGFFDSKVLSRMHAEVWSEDGKVLIKDVKSSNGTFINGVRLSPEGAESDLFELHTEDVVEFGIDIVSEDNKTIVHHKVAAKVYLVLNAEDALVSSREFNNWYRQAGDGSQLHRRGVSKPQQNQQQNNSGLSFEHVLSRLQGELQKSRDTSTNLGDLTSTLGEVHDTLGGGAPPPMPNGYAISAGTKFSFGSPKERDAQAQTIAALQAQLNDTQASLAGHVGQMRDLEGLLAEHDGIKREVGSLRLQMVEAQRDMELMLSTRLAQANKGSATDGRESPVAAMLEAQEDEDEDDTRSIASVDTVTHANGRAPLRATNGDHATEDEEHVASSTEKTEQTADILARERQLQEQNTRLTTRLETLSVELDEATKLGQALRSQHAEAAQAIRTLEQRVKGLELAVEGAAARETAAGAQAATEVDAKWDGWRKAFEASWQLEREGWHEEREKLLKVVTEWEARKEARSQRRRSTSREQGDSSSDSESDEDDGVELDENEKIEEADSVQTSLNGPSTSKGGSKAKRNRATRRRRRSTATQASLPSLANSIGSASGLSGTTKVASDSDDTVGGEHGGQSSADSAKGVKGSWNAAGGGANKAQASQAVPYGAAGAVFVMGAVTAWVLAAKLKE